MDTRVRIQKTRDLVDMLGELITAAENLQRETKVERYNTDTSYSPAHTVIVRAAQMLNDVLDFEALGV